MKTKNVLFGLFICLGILMSLNFVMGALTLNYPASSSTIGGSSAILNVTVPSADSGSANFSCSFYGISSLTANNTWSFIKTVSNNTAGSGWATGVNSTFNSAIFEDANNYQINATCSNNTGIIGTVVNTGITIDNTVPSTPTSITPTSDTDGSVTFSSTVVGANTTSCTLYFDGINPSQSSYSMTHSGNTCTKTLTMPEQTYRYYLITSDETNSSSASSLITLNVDTGGAKGVGNLVQEQGEGALSKKTLSISDFESNSSAVWIIISIIVVLSVYFIWTKS